MHAIIFGCVCMFCVSINSINLTAAGDNLKSVTRCINTFVLMCTGQVCLFVQYSSLLVICDDVKCCVRKDVVYFIFSCIIYHILQGSLYTTTTRMYPVVRGSWYT